MHLRGPLDILALLFVHPVGPGDHLRIERHALAVLAGSLVLGVHGARDGHHRLFAHFNLPVRQFQLGLHLLLMPLHQQPGEPENHEHGHEKNVDDEPAVVVDFLFLHQGVGPLGKDARLAVVEHREMEHKAAHGEVRIHNGAQRVLGHDGPVRFKAFQHVSHKGILDGIVDHLRDDLELAAAPGNPRRDVAFHLLQLPVHPDSAHLHPVEGGAGGKLSRVQRENPRVAGKVQLPALLIVPGPGIGRQAPVQAAPGVQQIIGDVRLAAEQLVPVRQVDAGAGEHKQAVRSLNPDIIVVVVGKIIQRPDGAVRIQIAQAVAGDHKNAAGFGIRHEPQDDFTAQSVGPGHELRYLPVLQHGDAVSVRTHQDGSVLPLQDGQHHAGQGTRLPADGMLYLMIPDKGDPGIPRRQHGSVLQLPNHPGPVAEGAAVLVIPVFHPVGFHLHQPLAVGADPQVVVLIHHHTADPDSLKAVRQLVPDLLLARQIHGVQPFVRADIVRVIPSDDGIDDPVVHAGRAVNIPEIGRRQAQQSQPGGGEPQVPLIVHQHIVNGVVEIVGIDPLVPALLIHAGDAVVRADKERSVLHPVQGFDILQPGAFRHVPEFEGSALDTEPVDFIARGGGQQLSLRRKGAALEIRLGARHPAGGDDLPLPQQVQGAVVGDRGHISGLVRGGVIRVGHLRKHVHLSQAAVERHHLHAPGGADVIVSVRALDDGFNRVGGQPPLLVDHVGNLLVDHNGQAVVVGADPEPALLVAVEAVDVPHRVELVHPPELPAVVAVQAGIGADPDHSVAGHGDIVGFPAGQAVGGRVDGLNMVVIVIRRGAVLRPGYRRSAAEGGDAQSRRQHEGGRLRGFFPAFRIGMNRFANQPVQPDEQEQGQQDRQLVHQLHIQFSREQPGPGRDSPLSQESYHRVAP